MDLPRADEFLINWESASIIAFSHKEAQEAQMSEVRFFNICAFGASLWPKMAEQ